MIKIVHLVECRQHNLNISQLPYENTFIPKKEEEKESHHFLHDQIKSPMKLPSVSDQKICVDILFYKLYETDGIID